MSKDSEELPPPSALPIRSSPSRDEDSDSVMTDLDTTGDSGGSVSAPSLLDHKGTEGDLSSAVDIDHPDFEISNPKLFNAFPYPSHYVSMKDALESKVKELEIYGATNSMSNTHLDWIAGHREDPDHPMTTHERAMQEKFDGIISTALGKPKKDYSMDWAKTSYIGMMLDGGGKTEPKHYVEIQLKRISGADKHLLKACGVDPDIVFATFADIVDHDNTTKNAREAKKHEEKGCFMINIDPRLLDPRHWAADQSSSSNITDPNLSRGSIASISDQNEVVTVVPTGHGPAESTWSMSGVEDAVRVTSHRDLMNRVPGAVPVKVSIPTDNAFAKRCDTSFVYIVRVVAVEVTGTCNEFSGPPLSQRGASLWCSGGWVVPALEDRLAHRNASSSKYYHYQAHDYKGPPKTCKYLAQGLALDGSFAGPVMKDGGHPAPVWKEPSDPCLEDVYALVWDMLAGRRFAGFRPGIGFGLTRAQSLRTRVAEECPFVSPSDEVLYHAANRCF